MGERLILRSWNCLWHGSICHRAEVSTFTHRSPTVVTRAGDHPTFIHICSNKHTYQEDHCIVFDHYEVHLLQLYLASVFHVVMPLKSRKHLSMRYWHPLQLQAVADSTAIKLLTYLQHTVSATLLLLTSAIYNVVTSQISRAHCSILF